MITCKLLIVEDDEDDVELLTEAFSQCGVQETHYTHSAMEAFKFLQSIEAKDDLPRLIVTDAYMPFITGAQFLKDLKGMEKYKHIHVVVLSSITAENEIEKFKQLGATDYLIKPSSYDEYVKLAKTMADKLLEDNPDNG